MAGHEIRALKQFIEGLFLFHTGGQLPRISHGDRRVETRDLHAEIQRGVGHLDADSAETDDAERFAGQFEANKLLLAGFDRFLQVFAGLLERLHIVARIAQVSGADQHARDHEFLDRVGICTRRVEHGNAAMREHVAGNVVGAGPGPADCRNRIRDLHVVHVVRTQQDCVRVRDLGRHLVALARQAPQSFHGDVVERQYLEHYQPCLFSNSAMKVINASTASSETAL